MSNLKIITFLFLVIGILSCSSKPEDRNTDADHEAIQAVLDEQLEEWNNGSVDGFMEGYWKSDSLLFMSKNGPQFGWETLRKMYHKSFPNREKMGNLTFILEEIRQLEENYLVVGRWLVDQGTGEKSGYFTLQFRSINDEWKIVADHTFSD